MIDITSEKKYDISICIVNWNAHNFLKDCLESIFQLNTLLSFEVIVVDNQSNDGSREMVSREFPQVKLIVNPLNNGFANGNNLAIMQAEGRYVLLLNPDTIVTLGALEAMVLYMDDHLEVGIVGPRLLHPKTNTCESSARPFPTLPMMIMYMSYLERIIPRRFKSLQSSKRYVNSDIATKVDWVTGACLMVRADLIEQVGLLDGDIFMYFEDVDWCYRFEKFGWETHYLPDILIYHWRGKSSESHELTGQNLGHSEWSSQQYAKSLIYFYRKHYGTVKTMTMKATFIILTTIKSAIWLSFGSLIFGVSYSLGRARIFMSALGTVIKS